MIKYRNECCNCHTEGYPCNGQHKRVPFFVCDRCRNEWDTLYDYEGEQLCENCVIKGLHEVEVMP